MIHSKLRLAAAKFALELANVIDLVDASHAALDDGIDADGLAVIASTPNTRLWKAKPYFTAALGNLGHQFTSQDDALRYLRLSYFGPVAERITDAHEGLEGHYTVLHFDVQFGPLATLNAWHHPSASELESHWRALDEMWNAQLVAWGVTDPSDRAWRERAIELCRDWCREYGRFYLQPVWRSPTVLALASAIHADRAFDRLPILADALEEAGCDHPDLLAHCRHASPHTDYCWLVDALLK